MMWITTIAKYNQCKSGLKFSLGRSRPCAQEHHQIEVTAASQIVTPQQLYTLTSLTWILQYNRHTTYMRSKPEHTRQHQQGHWYLPRVYSRGHPTTRDLQHWLDTYSSGPDHPPSTPMCDAHAIQSTRATCPSPLCTLVSTTHAPGLPPRQGHTPSPN